MTDHLVQHEHLSGVHDDEHDHGDGIFWKVFVVLLALTAAEVAWVEVEVFEGPALVAPLLLMMAVKFWLVAAFFMHLRFDLAILNGKLFTWAFASSLVLAVCVFAAVFGTMINRI
jgi:heme/copper-type cytochrome/quinol oxidase subunit 4